MTATDTLDETKYPNFERVVSGTVTVTKYDVTLLCDTSIAPVTINLLKIPSSDQTYLGQGNWSTQYKLYVVDYAQNSSVNNITIVAPNGFKINAAQSQVLNNNGGSLCVRIVSNLDYLATGALSAIAGANIPYVIATKEMQTVATYFAQTSNHTVRVGAQVDTYTIKSETGILVNSFNLATGLFTVPATGVYNLNANICCQINSNPNATVNTAVPPQHWVTGASDVGHFTIGILKYTNPDVSSILTANNKAITQNTSDVIISTSAMNVLLTQGDKYVVKVLNETNQDVLGVGDIQNQIFFSAHKIA